MAIEHGIYSRDYSGTSKVVIDDRPTIAGIVATTGSGKTTLLSSLMYQYFTKDATIVIVTEKDRSAFENAFCEFPVSKQYHKDILKRAQIEPMTKMQLRGLVKRYHPFTFIPFEYEGIKSRLNLKHRKIPPINWYTFDIKDIPEEAYSILLNVSKDAHSSRICKQIADGLDEDGNLFTFLGTVYNEITKDREENRFSTDPETMFIGGQASGTISSVERIRDGFLNLRKDFFISNQKGRYNLKLLDVLNDNKHIHIFSNFWMNDKRTKYFDKYMLIHMIGEAIGSGLVTRRICLVFEEIKVLLPKGDTEASVYENSLADILRNKLSEMRSEGRGCSIIATTQNFGETNRKFRTSLRQIIIGQLCPDDQRIFSELIDSDNMKLIKSLRIGEFVLYSECTAHTYANKFLAHVPPWELPESDIDYFEEYRKHYPDLLTNYSDLYKEMLEIRKQWEEERKAIVMEEKEEWKEQEAKKKESKEKRELALLNAAERIKMASKAVKVENDQKRDKREIMLKAYGMYKASVDKEMICAELDISLPTLKKYILSVARENQDADVIKMLTS